ncbi:MAG: hypothetical protein NTW94_09005 [Legionellales bacterium]|nr:hypothetical protein [Legionellales bacterium]
MTYCKPIALLFLGALLFGNTVVFANSVEEQSLYCRDSGGVVEEMPAEFQEGNSLVRGQSKLFCNFTTADLGFVSVGLETFASPEPSIAATYMKRLHDIKPGSSLMKGDLPNPSANVCKNLGGASIMFVAFGGFTSALGQSDICVFGDASMVSAWALIYMANHRSGYDEIKDKVKAMPLNFKIK